MLLVMMVVYFMLFGSSQLFLFVTHAKNLVIIPCKIGHCLVPLSCIPAPSIDDGFFHLCNQVLPPLRDVTNRPEVGSTGRNKLVRLMTHVDLGVKQIAAEFLFVLCKERGRLNSLCLMFFIFGRKFKKISCWV